MRNINYYQKTLLNKSELFLKRFFNDKILYSLFGNPACTNSPRVWAISVADPLSLFSIINSLMIAAPKEVSEYNKNIMATVRANTFGFIFIKINKLQFLQHGSLYSQKKRYFFKIGDIIFLKRDIESGSYNKSNLLFGLVVIKLTLLICKYREFFLDMVVAFW